MHSHSAQPCSLAVDTEPLPTASSGLPHPSALGSGQSPVRNQGPGERDQAHCPHSLPSCCGSEWLHSSMKGHSSCREAPFHSASSNLQLEPSFPPFPYRPRGGNDFLLSLHAPSLYPCTGLTIPFIKSLFIKHFLIKLCGLVIFFLLRP